MFECVCGGAHSLLSHLTLWDLRLLLLLLLFLFKLIEIRNKKIWMYINIFKKIRNKKKEKYLLDTYFLGFGYNRCKESKKLFDSA